MKTFVFVCLLSLSMCLSQPTTKLDAPTPTQQTVTDPKAQATPKVEQKSPQNGTQSAEPIIVTTPSTNEAAKDGKNNPKDAEPKPIDNKTEHKDAKGEKEGASEKQPTEKAPPAPTETKPAEGKAVSPTSETKPSDNNAVVPADKNKKNETTTVHPAAVVTPTVAPNVTEKPTVLARGFDGASFVGGIILTLGLLAIGFMGFKYYKNQTERNYHTL